MSEFTDITYQVEGGLATITINRPERYNAFRAQTVDELVLAFKRAWGSPDVGVIALTGAGDKAFCSGGDQKQRAETGDYVIALDAIGVGPGDPVLVLDEGTGARQVVGVPTAPVRTVIVGYLDRVDLA